MNNEVMESNVMNSEVSTNVVSDDQMKSRLCLTFWFRDVASPIPSWHSLRRGGVTFAKTILDLLTYCVALCNYSFGFGSNFR